jgi:hypothetical protein
MSPSYNFFSFIIFEYNMYVEYVNNDYKVLIIIIILHK